MAILSALLLGVATNLDNLAIGAMLAAQGKRLPTTGNFIIAAGSALAAWLLCWASGCFVQLADWLRPLGGVLLLVIGLLPAFQAAYRKLRGLPAVAEEGRVPELDLRHTLLLSAALAVNCLPVAVAAGLLGMPSWLLALSVGLCSLFTVRLGCRWGRALLGVTGQRVLSWGASLLLVGLGLAELLM